MSEAVMTSRLSRKRRFSEEKRTPCIFGNKPSDEDKSGFLLDAWNRMREKAIELEGKNKIWVLHVGVLS